MQQRVGEDELRSRGERERARVRRTGSDRNYGLKWSGIGASPSCFQPSSRGNRVERLNGKASKLDKRVLPKPGLLARLKG